jgi:hypothetical protein
MEFLTIFGRHGVYGPIERNAQDERRMLAGRCIGEPGGQHGPCRQNKCQ